MKSRKDQISLAAKEYLKAPHAGFGAKFDFASGAEWADANPVREQIEPKVGIMEQVIPDQEHTIGGREIRTGWGIKHD